MNLTSVGSVAVSVQWFLGGLLPGIGTSIGASGLLLVSVGRSHAIVALVLLVRASGWS